MKRLIFTLLLGFVGANLLIAQTRSITGTVSDGTETLPGATVQIKGTIDGTITDIDGNYTIEATEGDVLVFSFVGMSTHST